MDQESDPFLRVEHHYLGSFSRSIIFSMIDISYNIFMMSTFVSLCSSSSSSSSSYKKLYKSTPNYGIINNQYINVKSISIEKLKNYFYRLDQLPFIDEMYQNDQCK